jgi:ABC-type microcin C transport system duplicated ATPase subunit YejF
VLQDPFSSLNPRTRVGTAIGEPLTVHKLVRGKQAREARVGELPAWSGCRKSSRRAIRTNCPAGSVNG